MLGSCVLASVRLTPAVQPSAGWIRKLWAGPEEQKELRMPIDYDSFGDTRTELLNPSNGDINMQS